MKYKSFLLFFCFFTVFNPCLFAQTKKIVIAYNSNYEPLQDVIDGFKHAVKQEQFDYKLIEYRIDVDAAPPSEADKADLFFTIGSNATQLILKRNKTIPVVFTLVVNPNFTEQNITGVKMDVPFNDQFNVLTKISPRPRKIGIIYDPSKTKGLVETCIEESKGTDFDVVTRKVSSVDDVYGAIRSFRSSIDCLLVLPDPTVYTSKSTADILLFSLREGLPVIGLSQAFVKAGALFSLTSNYKRMGEKAGLLTARIFRGEKPSDIKIEAPDKYDLTINLIVAQRLGVTFNDKLINEAENVYQ